MKKLIVTLFICLAGIVNLKAQSTEADKIVGVWQVGSGKARVKISKYGEKYSGKIVWLKEPNYEDGTAKRDKNNSDETKRNVPLLGYTNLLGFEYKGENVWDNGTIYDPENGSTYKCTITMTADNVLEVRGYIGVSLFGRTDTWKRLEIKK
jgi:uncharacterized protein (DUF2147 family)